MFVCMAFGLSVYFHMMCMGLAVDSCVHLSFCMGRGRNVEMTGENPTSLEETLTLGTSICSFIDSNNIYQSPTLCQAQVSVLDIEQDKFLNCMGPLV